MKKSLSFLITVLLLLLSVGCSEEKSSRSSTLQKTNERDTFQKTSQYKYIWDKFPGSVNEEYMGKILDAMLQITSNGGQNRFFKRKSTFDFNGVSYIVPYSIMVSPQKDVAIFFNKKDNNCDPFYGPCDKGWCLKYAYDPTNGFLLLKKIRM